jgi:ketosteroid isomerase-like protein
MKKADEVGTKLLEDFAAAWNRHDADALMSFMTNDCAFETAEGPDACGTRWQGPEAVRAAFSRVWQIYPDARWEDARHVVDGDRGFSEWTFRGTDRNGAKVEVRGVDLFIFRGGKIALKDTFRKKRTG